ncbi:hypothetical protein LEMLEM_LOCUS3360, partial [Lemmus lemmus]
MSVFPPGKHLASGTVRVQMRRADRNWPDGQSSKTACSLRVSLLPGGDG